jgi:hypothetical protein
MEDIRYSRRKAATTGYVTRELRTIRCDWCEDRLEERPLSEDWKDVGWSDELHFPIVVAADTKHVTRKAGERYKEGCIQRKGKKGAFQKRSSEPAAGQVHAFILTWYGNRDILFYEPTNKVGKMTVKQYCGEVLPWANKWLKEEGLTLQEDCDSAHKAAATLRYKDEHGIRSFLKPPASPDLSISETLSRSIKGNYYSRGHWDEWEVRQWIVESYFHTRQEIVQKWILGMPKRLRDVIDSDGEMLSE